jgi:tRNA pseudouridine38-40 synthase
VKRKPNSSQEARGGSPGAGERLRLDLAFVGTPYRGWQSQAKGATVQDLLDSALRSVGHRGPRPVGCSRTDAGVHARLYTAHVEGTPSRSPGALLNGLNANLPPEIRVYRASRAQSDFHARFSCSGKTYIYHLYTGPVVPPFLGPYVWVWRGPLDRGAMESGARLVGGEHDFAAFTTVEGRDKKTRIRVDSVRWEERGPILALHVEGKAFLHRMVRCIAGALVGLGTGRLSLDDLEGALGGDCSGPLLPALPAQGLVLWEVRYPGAGPADAAGQIPASPLFPL